MRQSMQKRRGRHPVRFCRAILACFVAALAAHPQAAPAKAGKPVALDSLFRCGTSPQRDRDAVARSRYRDSQMRRRPDRERLLLSQAAAALQPDRSAIAILEDDGTLTARPNFFDLKGKAVRFVPATEGRYQVVSRDAVFSAGEGVKLLLTDDDSAAVPLFPPFSFYGKSYSSVIVNSDGNLTFGQPDAATSARDLGRFAWGPPRIGPFFSDLDPAAGSLFHRREPDGIVFVWDRVPAFDTAQYNSFSVKLFDDGAIEFAFGSAVNTPDAIVGISPGLSDEGVAAIDFSAPAPELLEGTIAEVFTLYEQLSETSIARKFYLNHPDEFDQIVVFLGFPYDLPGNAFSYELTVINQVGGIGMDFVDDSADYSSAGRLKSIVMMGSLDAFPADPNQEFMRTYNSLQVVTHEVAHRWLAFPYLREGGFNTLSLLHSSDQAHWSFFFNADASLMEGNQILDLGTGLGNQRFRTSEVTNRLSELDRYLMGFLPAAGVSPMFYVKNPTGTTRTSNSLPSHGATAFGGTRHDFTVDDVAGANGQRLPSYYQSQKVHRIAFVLVTKPGAPVTEQAMKLQQLHDAWVPYFNQLTGGEAWAATNLQSEASTTPSKIHFPYNEGDSARYTGFALANYGTAAADVLFRYFDNSGSEMSTPSGILNPRMITIPPGRQIAMLGSQILGLSAKDTQNGWMMAESTSSLVSGFFLSGDLEENYLDGAVAGNGAATSLCFTRAHGTSAVFRNVIDVINPDAAATARLSFKLFRQDGQQQGAAVERELRPQGRLAEALSSLFPGTDAGFAGYVLLSSDVGVIGYETFEGSTTTYALPAQPPSTATRLYSVQFASGPGGPVRYFTDMSLVNASAEPRRLQVTLVGNDGRTVFAKPVEYMLPPGAQKLVRGEAIFGLPDAATAATLTEGTVVITADGPGILGDVTFGDALAGRFMAGLPLDGTPGDRFILSQVAVGDPGSGTDYFTGLGIHNPNSGTVLVTIDVYSETGIRTGTATFPMEPATRLSKMLHELIPGFAGQLRGYIRISTAGGPVITFELFGDTSVNFLAAVPPQSIIR